jgi:DNA-binding MarR family transcriptional regulator
MNKTHTSRFRSFSRSVAVEIGALEDSFLDRGRPLGAARVLNAIGLGFNEVSQIREHLRLDTGLLSRLLRSLEAEGLIETEQSLGDRRNRTARLTPAGVVEFELYEKLSEDRAIQILSRHKNKDQLLEAMDLITAAFSRDRIILEVVDYTSEMAGYCLERYAGELSARLNLDFDLANAGGPDPSEMEYPNGTFIVARIDQNPVGCVGIKGQGGALAEVKRLWIAPSARGLGLARRLMVAAEDAARDLSITTLRLDTNSTLSEAVSLYKNSGWHEIERYNDDPYPDVFFEKNL